MTMSMQERRVSVLVQFLKLNNNRQFLLDELRVELNTKLPSLYRFNNNNTLVHLFIFLPKFGLRLEPIINTIKLNTSKSKKIKYYKVLL